LKKTELIEAIAERADVPKSQAQEYFDAFEEVVTDTLKGGKEVQITGFGKFYVREQKARVSAVLTLPTARRQGSCFTPVQRGRATDSLHSPL
jgi:nucleoid DNA-binding protein